VEVGFPARNSGDESAFDYAIDYAIWVANR
jgi:hypothetical protein